MREGVGDLVFGPTRLLERRAHRVAGLSCPQRRLDEDHELR
jgi:hypothetical protein